MWETGPKGISLLIRYASGPPALFFSSQISRGSGGWPPVPLLRQTQSVEVLIGSIKTLPRFAVSGSLRAVTNRGYRPMPCHRSAPLSFACRAGLSRLPIRLGRLCGNRLSVSGSGRGRRRWPPFGPSRAAMTCSAVGHTPGRSLDDRSTICTIDPTIAGGDQLRRAVSGPILADGPGKA